MDKVCIDAVEERLDSSTLQRPLTDALNTNNIALNYYELAPGDSFAYGYHKHEKQEELFIIQAGSVNFKTEEGEVNINAGEVIRFAPGEYQQGINTGEEWVEALVIGSPKESGNIEIRRKCETCEEWTSNSIEVVDGENTKITRCQECGSETARFE
ncbi:cupin domain-containing protein [Halorientalis marina]|jgi:uncharacterized cupin superfamily protein|uniref:cupin domain-containing protein n=1 Tax=Halorientalis marina TaxID=2931976 RepID=UPI001FF58D1D|nr:cupin domain-containing protein [Halorientalis marina]